MADQRLFSECADLGELGIFFDLNAPSLIISEVPVEGVELVRSDKINVFFDERYREHVAAYIQMHTPVGVARLILNVDSRNDLHCRSGFRKELYKRLHGIKKPCIFST